MNNDFANYEVGNPEMAWLLLAVPVVAMLYLYSRWANRRAREQFGAAVGKTRWLSGLFSASLLAVGVALLALACMDIRWGETTREVPQRGLEVVFALDVSRSMLAQDAKPDRLTRAKQQIKDMLAEMAGDRVGLVVFAGQANQAVPLTNHYHDFQQKLDSVGPESVSAGGSQLGVAIKAASDAFLSKTNDHKTVVLFTDGEDQESQPIELAKQLHAENGLRIFTVGLGDVTEGARIPDNTNSRRTRRDKFVQHNGQQVWSKLNGNILKQIATESNAAYIPAGTKRVNMAQVYHRYIANVEKAEFETAKINALIPRYQWFALPAFVCIFLHSLMGSTSRKSRLSTVSSKAQQTTRRQNRSSVGKVAAILLLSPALAFGQTDSTTSDSVASKINAANELVRQQKTAEAIDAYNAIDETASRNREELQYNLASAHYRNSDIESAETLFAMSASSEDERISRDSRYNLGNCHYAKALPLVEQQPEAAIAELDLAVKQYRSALRVDGSFSDARENLERARKLIERLKQQQEDQQDKQDQQSQDDKQSDQNQEQNKNSKDDSKENQSEGEKSKESESPKQQSPENSEQQQQDSESNSSQSESEQTDSNDSKEQSENANSSEQQSERQDSQKQNSQESQGSQESSEQASDRQQAHSQKQSASEQEEDLLRAEKNKEGKQPPDGKLSAANDADSKEQSDKEKMQASLARQSDQDNGMMTRQEALKLLQAVRDRDMLRRLRQKQRQRRNRVQVERDW